MVQIFFLFKDFWGLGLGGTLRGLKADKVVVVTDEARGVRRCVFADESKAFCFFLVLVKKIKIRQSLGSLGWSVYFLDLFGFDFWD